MPKKLISIRVDEKQLARLCKILGLVESKAIRACMNFTENVIHHWFGGEITYMFRRKPDNETTNYYKLEDNMIKSYHKYR